MAKYFNLGTLKRKNLEFRKVIQQFTDGEHVCIVYPNGRFFLDCGHCNDNPDKKADMIVEALNNQRNQIK